MLRRDFLGGVSVVSVVGRREISLKDAISILEDAARREIPDIEDIRVEIEPDPKKRIALLFSVVRKKAAPTQP
ncbi:hypothetical protein NL154_05515 [Rhizobium sp. YTUHZ044]|uniref:hypothetical protein n=1 Tax=Rhizobium sp. YTUHZ044 TaxID=2962678 RepID=UPI003DA9E6E4